MSIIVSDSAKASRPGLIKIQPAKFLSYFGITGLKKYYYLFVFSRFSKESLYRRFSNDPLVMLWIEKTEHFELGCINPAIVLNKEKGLIATFTNLANTSSVSVPVFKITMEKLHLVKCVQLFNGQQIPTVALYLGNI